MASRKEAVSTEPNNLLTHSETGTMSQHEDTPQEIIGTNDVWSGAEASYRAGILFDESLFPGSARDQKIWGPQDPQDWIGTTGPFDEDEGDEAWRMAGRYMFTGDAKILSRKPNKVQEEQRTNFWKTYDARLAERRRARNPPQEDSGEARFPDAFPKRSKDGLVLLPPTPETHPHLALPKPAHTQTVQDGSRASFSHPQGIKRKRSKDKQGSTSLLGSALSDIAGNASVPQAQAQVSSSIKKNTARRSSSTPAEASSSTRALRSTSTPAQRSISTPPVTMPPHDADKWEDKDLLNLWQHKVIRKKGYEPMLVDFPGHTPTSLHAVWKARRSRCEELGAEWRKAGKPDGPIEEWLVD